MKKLLYIYICKLYIYIYIYYVDNSLKGLFFQAGFQPAEMKFQSAPMQLIKVESSIKLTSDWYASLLSKTPQKLLKNVQVRSPTVCNILS